MKHLKQNPENSQKIKVEPRAVFSLKYQLVLVVDYGCKPFYDEAIRESLKNIMQDLAGQLEVEIINQESVEDHIHIFFKAKPTTDLAKVVNTFKSASGRLIRKEHPEMEELLWGDSFCGTLYAVQPTLNFANCDIDGE